MGRIGNVHDWHGSNFSADSSDTSNSHSEILDSDGRLSRIPQPRFRERRSGIDPLLRQRQGHEGSSAGVRSLEVFGCVAVPQEVLDRVHTVQRIRGKYA